MPTVYPKCSPSEMLGLLVLLGDHKGDEEIARLADDLDLEIDEILPAIDFSQVLGFLKVTDGRATLTPLGRSLLAGSITGRREIIREQLGRATLFKALLRALDGAPEHRLTEEEVLQIMSLTTAPADELVQNIINWGRYAGMFRYDSDEHLLLPPRGKGSRSSGSRRPPPSPPEAKDGSSPPAVQSSGDSTGPTPRPPSLVPALA